MAIQISKQVWEVGPRVKDPRLILALLAEHANEGGHCFPSVALLQQKACMPKRSTLRALKYLEDEGWIEVERRVTNYGRAKGNLYHINLRKLGIGAGVAPHERRTGASVAPHELESPDPRGAKPDPRGAKCGAHEVPNVQSPPAPPLCVNHQEPSVKTPLPPATAGGSVANAIGVAELQARLKAAPLGSREYFAIGFELLQAQAKAHPAAIDTPAASPPVLMAPEFADLEGAAGWVMGELGFAQNKRLQLVLRELLAAAPPGRGGLSGTAAAMVAAWRAYVEAGPMLRWGPWSPQKFFKLNHWRNPGLWPIDAEKAQRVQRAERGF